MLAVAALVSCSKEQTVSFDKGEEIGFNSFVENSTRADAATDPSYKASSLDHFNVYGAVNDVNIFGGIAVTKTDGVWSYTGNTQYWIAGAPYKFAAVVDATYVETGDNGLPTVLSYTTASQTDMLYDYVTTTGQPEDNNGLVAFQFTHLLSKVKFSVTNTTAAAATNYRVKITSAKLLNVYPSGTYTVNGDDGTWDPDTASDYVLENNYEVNSGATQYNSQEVLLIPGSAVGVYVKAEIQATDDDGQTWTKVSTMEKTFENALGKTGDTPNVLVANNAYHFAVKLGIGTDIQFTATMLNDWTQNTDTELK